MAVKFTEGDVAGAVREISYPESIVPNCRETLKMLKRERPPAPTGRPKSPDASLVRHVATKRQVLGAREVLPPGFGGWSRRPASGAPCGADRSYFRRG